jgi:hypothetical protein
MDQSDIREIVDLLENALKLECWDTVEESISYLREYMDTTDILDGCIEE